MPKLFYPFCLLVLFYLSCSNNNPSSGKPPTEAPDSDSACYISTIRNFLQWYEVNHNAIDSIQIIEVRKDSGWYQVDFKGVEKYISFLRSSGHFSEKFLSDKYKYFQQCNDSLTINKQNDGPPEGLDFDLLLFTQEPEEILKKSPLLEIDVLKTGKEARLVASDHNLLFKMVPASGKCQIDNIQWEEKSAK